MAPSPLPFLIAEGGQGDKQAREALFCSSDADLGPVLGSFLSPAAATGARVTVVPGARAHVMVVAGPQRALIAVGADGQSADGRSQGRGLWTVVTADRGSCPAIVADFAEWLRSLEELGGLGPLSAAGVSSAAELLEELVIEADIVETGHRLVLPGMQVTGPAAAAKETVEPGPAEEVSEAVAEAVDAALDSLNEDWPQWSAHRHGGRLLHVRSSGRGTFLQAAQALESVPAGTDAAAWSTGPTQAWAVAARIGRELFHVESDARGQVLWRHYRLGPLATPISLARNPELANRARVGHGALKDPFPEAVSALAATGVNLAGGPPSDCPD
jgi:hypothetical protein